MRPQWCGVYQSLGKFSQCVHNQHGKKFSALAVHTYVTVSSLVA